MSKTTADLLATTTLGEAEHFGVFMLKAVLSGRGGELVHLAKDNLLR